MHLAKNSIPFQALEEPFCIQFLGINLGSRSLDNYDRLYTSYHFTFNKLTSYFEEVSGNVMSTCFYTSIIHSSIIFIVSICECTLSFWKHKQDFFSSSPKKLAFFSHEIQVFTRQQIYSILPPPTVHLASGTFCHLPDREEGNLRWNNLIHHFFRLTFSDQIKRWVSVWKSLR